MSETPLRRYLASTRQKAEAFATAHGLSPWSVRHWASGRKHPTLDAQQKLEIATGGAVTPANWLAFSLSRSASEQPVPLTTIGAVA